VVGTCALDHQLDDLVVLAEHDVERIAAAEALVGVHGNTVAEGEACICVGTHLLGVVGWCEVGERAWSVSRQASDENRGFAVVVVVIVVVVLVAANEPVTMELLRPAVPETFFFSPFCALLDAVASAL
jgi:hypothetical protein